MDSSVDPNVEHIARFMDATSNENAQGGALPKKHIRMFRSWIQNAPTLDDAIGEWHRANQLSGNEPLKIAYKHKEKGGEDIHMVSGSDGPLIRTPAMGKNATGGFTKLSEKHITENLNNIVDDMCVVRMPLKRGLEEANDAMLHGEALDSIPFDDVFRLFILVRIMGREYSIDKSKNGSSVRPFNREILHGNRRAEIRPIHMLEYFSLGQFLKAAVMQYGPIPCCGHGTSVRNGEIQQCRHKSFFGYNAKTNNSQLFVDRLLYAATQKGYLDYSPADKEFVNKKLSELAPVINQTKVLADEFGSEAEQRKPKISIITLENIPPIYGAMFKKDDVDKLWSFANKSLTKATDLSGGALRMIRHLARHVRVPTSDMSEKLRYMGNSTSPVELAHKITMINNTDPMIAPSGHSYTVPEFLGGLAHGGSLEDASQPEFVDYKKNDAGADGLGISAKNGLPAELEPLSVNNKPVNTGFMDTLLRASSREQEPVSELMQTAFGQISPSQDASGGSLAAYDILTGDIRDEFEKLDNIENSSGGALGEDHTSGKTAEDVFGGGILDWVSDAWDGVKDAASSAWDTVKDAASSVANTVADTASNVWDGVKETASDAWDGVKDVATDLIPHALEALAEPLAGAASEALEPLIGSGAAEAIGTVAPMVMAML